MYRGCRSDRDKFTEYCRDSPSQCLNCGRNGCNNQPQSRPPSLSCITCEDKLECPWGQNVTKSKHCKSNVFFSQVETCFSFNDTRAESVKRGCTLDDGQFCNESSECEQCESKNCNVKNVAEQSCVQCSGTLGESCANLNNTANHSRKCTDSIYSYHKRGCYRRVSGNIQLS